MQAQLETERKEAARLDQARLAQLEVARKEALQREQAKQAQLEAERKEAARLEQARQEQARQAQLEAARKAALQREQANQAQLEAARKEAARQEQAREAQLEAERKEALQREQAKQAQLEAGRRQQGQETTRQAPSTQAAAQAPAGQDQAQRERAEQEAKREERLRAIAEQLREEAAQRDPASNRPSQPLLPSASSLRRGWLFGRADPNTDLVQYAAAMSRKIEMNMTFDMVRDAVKQPHTRPVVTVAVRADGSVEKVSFVVSSGVAAIDDLVRKVIASQAPYGAFPPALARQYDVIEIRRTWIFDMAIRLE